MPVVHSLTLNPCLDKTLTVPPWKPGDNVRGTAVREVVGGKGNNVARALRRLGVGARPVTFLGGATGQRCRELLIHDDGFEPLIIDSRAETRTILTVRTGESAIQSAFFDPDPQISADEACAMRTAIELAIRNSQVRALTLSGSSPSEETHSLFAECVELAQRAGIPVLMDTYGPSLLRASGSAPDVVQTNLKEAAGALKVESDQLSEAVIFDWLSSWVKRGTKLALVTQGPGSVLAVSKDAFWRVIVPKIDPVNPIGSGDSLLAGLCRGLLGDEYVTDILRYAVACGVANAAVWDAGAIDPRTVSGYAELIEIHQVRIVGDKFDTIVRA
ncbi:carbohydrate kinase [bacterium]|nr:carbohydrate kinase [bacterium]